MDQGCTDDRPQIRITQYWYRQIKLALTDGSRLHLSVVDKHTLCIEYVGWLSAAYQAVDSEHSFLLLKIVILNIGYRPEMYISVHP